MVSMGGRTSLTKKILLSGLILSLVVVSVYVIHPSLFIFINDKTTDAIVALTQKETSGTGSIVIVDLDEQSLKRFGQLPWPRYRLGRLLHKIKESGAKSVGLDMILSEPDRTSPNYLQATIARELDYQLDFSKVPSELFDHDRYLAEILAEGPFVIGYEFLFKNKRSQSQAHELHPLHAVRITKPNASPSRIQFFKAHSVVCNLPVFANAVTYSGFLNATPDADGILRRIPLVIQYGDQLFPSFALATLMQFKGVAQLHLREEKSGFFYLALNDKRIPIDCQGNMLINFGVHADAFSRISAADVLDDNIPSEKLMSKIVLVSSSAAGWEQTYQTPNCPVASHGEILAKILENLVSGNFIIRPHAFFLWETLVGLILAALLCFSIAKNEILVSSIVGALCLLGTWLGAQAIFRFNGFLFSPFLPTTLILSNYVVLTIYKTRKKHHLVSQKADDTLVLLKASENSLNSIVQTIPDIVFRVDPGGRITFISPAIAKYVSSHDELLGQSIFNFVFSEDLNKSRYHLNERRTGKRATFGLELRLLLQQQQNGPDEEAGYFSLSAEGIYNFSHGGDKKFLGTQGILRDITAQKRLENKLMQAQKMETIGNLAAGIAHDLNNILGGLVSYPDLILLELPPDSPIYKKVTIMQKSGQKAAAIVQDLMTLARRGVTINEVINVNTIIKEYLASPEYDNLKKRFSQTTVEIDLKPDLMNIKGSPVHLSKALMNILNNAFEAMPAGGSIHLSTSNNYIDAPRQAYEEIPEGEYVCLQVDDEGVGIDSADIKRIFEPFYTKKKMQQSGSGLGMTVIWATIKDHSGYIDIQSREGEGTCINIYFPVTREVADSKKQRIVLEDYVGAEHILIVDDIPEQLEIAVRMLSKLGYKISSVSSGEAAVAFMREHKADLLVLDMIMPNGIDGLETYKRIIEIHPRQKAIIASGYSESENVKVLQKLGAGVYIQKPYTLERIGCAVRHELDRQS